MTDAVGRWRVREGARPTESRLIDAALGANGWVAASIVAGLGAAALVIGQAWLISTIVAAVFVDKGQLAATWPSLGLLAVLVVGRGPPPAAGGGAGPTGPRPG